MTYYNPNYDKRYTVPWTLKYTDKDGKEQMEAGAVLTNQFHQQSYYPDPFDFGCDRDSVTFEGAIIRSSLDMSAPSYIEFYRAPASATAITAGITRQISPSPKTPITMTRTAMPPTASISVGL